MTAIQQLLAAWGVDDVALSTYAGGQYACILRDPQPDEDAVHIDTAVRLVLVDLDADPVDGATFDFELYVAGSRVLSYVAGTPTWEGGWTGTVTAPTTDDPYTAYAVEAAQPTTPAFAGEQVVTARAVVNPGAPPDLDTSWTFTIEDVTPPTLLSAEALADRTVRLTFDDAMALSGDGSALDATAYAIARQNVDPAPAVDLTVTAVVVVDGSCGTQVDLTTQWEHTPGCAYLVTVGPSVSDDAGNGIDAAACTATFAGFQPDVPAGRRFDHWTMMVPLINRTEDDTGDLQRFSGCIQEILDLLLTSVDRFVDQFDVDRCSDAAVDAMLADLGNPFDWAALELTATQRRKLATYLVQIYQAKGTAVGIEQTILFLLGVTAHVVPYQIEGWTLDVDLLGAEGAIAEVGTLAVAPFDLTAVAPPWVVAFAIDDGDPQAVTLVAGDFADPSAGTAAELAAALAAGLTGAGTYVAADGAPALVVGTLAPPFALSGGEALEVTLGGVAYAATFAANDFAVPGDATLTEVLRVLRAELPDALAAVAHPDGGVALYTRLTGALATLEITAGAAATALGLAAGSYAGTDGDRTYVYSLAADADASVACTSAANALSVDVLGFWAAPGAGAGGTVLAPSDRRALYTFDIEVEGAVDAATEALIRAIATYMRAAHEHLANVRPAPTVAFPDGWILGVDELDISTDLFPEGADELGGGAGYLWTGGEEDEVTGFGLYPFGLLPFGLPAP